MKIALIIPYRNAEKWIKRCLDSIKGDFEVILVDDHSKDGSHEIVDNHPNHDNFIHACTMVTHGVSAARNVGLYNAIEVVGADYIAFLDADDELHPDAYKNMCKAISEAPDDGIIQFNHLMVTGDTDKDFRIPVPRMHNRQGTYFLNNLPKLWVSVVNKIYKAELVDRVMFNPHLSHGEDELFNLECLRFARRIYNSELVTMIHHKDNPNSLSKSTTSGDLLNEQSALIEFLAEAEEDTALCEAVRQRQAELWSNPCYKRVFGGA